MYPDKESDFLGRATFGNGGGTKKTDAHGIIGIKECNFHGRTVFAEINAPYRACAG